MQLITGRTGEHHVYASDDAELYKLFLGNGNWILPTGNQLNAQLSQTTPNAVNIYDGSLIMQGRLAKIRPTTGFEEVTYDVGTVGYKRVDLIVAEYVQETISEEEEIGGEIVVTTDKIESVTLKVIKGTPTVGAYVEPEIETGNMDLGEINQVKLWAVRIDGVNFDGLVDYRTFLTDTPYDTLLATARQVQDQVASIMADLTSQLAEFAADISSQVLTGAVLYSSVEQIADIVSVANRTLTFDLSGITLQSGDTIELYINGLKTSIEADGYSVSTSNDDVIFTFDRDVFASLSEDDYAEIVVRR